jgi:hypothetical protein
MQLMLPVLHNLLGHWSLALAIQWHPVKIEMTQCLDGGKIPLVTIQQNEVTCPKVSLDV